jgi:predicted ribosome-associated RNA-binding protein Tma20/translation initiation factor 1 (eIF-1/SUI1)
MFKNEINTTQSYILSKKEKKDLCKKWTITYNSQCVEYILKEFNELNIFKTSLKRRIITYENNPIFFEYDNDLYYPTVYLLNYFPNFVKRKCIIYDETDGYLDNGADLMLKGILNRLDIKKESFKLNDLFVVQTVSGIVTSVGISQVSSNTMNVENPIGKFLKVIHRINDSLWDFGTKKLPQNLISSSNIVSDQNVLGQIENFLDTVQVSEKIDDKISEKIPIEEEAKEVNVKGVNDEIEEKEDREEEQRYSEEEIDKNINTVFFTVLKLVIKPDMLPLDPGKLLKDYVKPLSKELNLYIDFKQSSYKKFNTYLKHLQKQLNLLTFVKPKNMQNAFITNISFDDPLIKDFKPPVNKVKFLEQATKIEEKDNILLNKDEKIQITQLYKPNQSIKPIFELTDPNFAQKDYYQAKECHEILTTYLKNKNLFIKGSSDILINDELGRCLFRKAEERPKTLKIDEIIERWKSNLKGKDIITKTTGDEVSEICKVPVGGNLKVRICAKKLNNKKVTIIEGLENFVNVKDAIKTFSKHFACAVTIKDHQHVKDAIFIQGYWVFELQTLLQSEIKLNKNFIQIDDKLGIKPKKK